MNHETLSQIGRAIATQDNRITCSPIFVVEDEERIWHIDPASGDYPYSWINSDFDELEQGSEDAVELEERLESGEDCGSWAKVHYTVRWQFRTAAFTEKACQDYIDQNGHNLRNPRIYAYGSNRNQEFRAIRQFLLELAIGQEPPPNSAPTSDPKQQPTCRHFQKLVHDWSQKTFPHQTPQSKFEHLTREIKELESDLSDGEEMADCFILLAGLAEMKGVDLMTEALKKLATNQNREWGPPDSSGVSSHLE